MNEDGKGRGKIRLLILSDQTLFARSVEDMLRQESSLEVLGWERDPNRASQAIAQAHPDIVILAGLDASTEFAPAVIAILRQDPAIKVVEVNLQSNDLLIYGKELRVVREAGDLLMAIQQSVSRMDELTVGEPGLPQ